MKKVINLLMLSTIIMSQITLSVTALAVEIDTNESNEIVTETTTEDMSEDTSSTEEKSEEEQTNREEKQALNEKDDVVSQQFEGDEDVPLIGPKLYEDSTRGSTMEISNNFVYIPLGSDDAGIEKAFKKETVVKIDGSVSTDYSLKNVLNTDDEEKINTDIVNVEPRTLKASVVDNANPFNAKGTVSLYHVNYYSSIVFASDENDTKKLAGAYTLHSTNDSGQYKITGSNALGDGNGLVHKDYSGKNYYKLDVFRPEAGSTIIDSDTQSVGSITATGSQKKGSALKTINNVKEGDLVRAWSAVPNNNRLYRNTGSTNALTIEKNADSSGYATYQVTKNGFVLVKNYTPLTVVERVINTTTTNAQLDETIEDSFKEIPEGVKVNRFTQYPSRTKVGKSNGKIEVIENSKVTGYKDVTTIYEVPFNVVEQPLEVELKENSILLGTDWESLDVYDFIDSVYYNGTELSKDEYTAEFIAVPNTMTVGKDDEVDIEVTLKNDKAVNKTERTSANITWGNTLVSKSDVSVNSPMMTSISLFETNSKPKLKMTYGTGNNNRYRSGNVLNIYRENETNVLFSKKEEKSWSYQQNVIQEWQPELDKIDLKYGDVLKQSPVDFSGESFNGAATFVSRDEELVAETKGFQNAYYELTVDGYRLLKLNQMTVNSNIPTFNTKTTIEEMNEEAANQMILPTGANSSDYRFEYASVDTTTPGVKKTKMNVYEKLATGGEFMTTYDVSYEVVQALDTLKVDLQEVSIPVGTKIEWLNANDYVKEVRLGDKKLNSSEYTASFVKNPDTNLVSTNTKTGEVKKQSTQITIETKETKQVKTEATQTMIIWGHGITTKSSSESFTMSGVSLLENKGKPYLIANQGIGYSSSGMQYDPSISLYRGNISNGLIKDGSNAGVTTTSILTQYKWNEELSQIDVAYGDVFGYTVKKADGTSYSGRKTWATRNEELVLETEGFEDAYYEVTKDGLRLMHFNQFTVNTTIPSFEIGTSKEEMNKVAEDQLVLPKGADSNNYRYEYVSVDTKTPGKKTTKMNVYEKLATGGEFMTTYDVSYEVLEGISVQLQEVSIPVGTKTEFLNPNDFVKEVKLGDKKLNSSEYTASFSKIPDTSTVSAKTTPGDVRKSETKIQVVKNGTNQTVTETTAANITWSHTITTKTSSGTYTAAAISLLDNNDKPYLAANTGVLFSTSNLTFDPTVSAYRNNMNTPLISDGTNAGKDEKPNLTMNKWNTTFDSLDLKYGDVFGYTVNEANGNNSLGKRTWASRNEELVLETEGFDTAYYELTKEGYRLMRFNQFTASDTNPAFEIGTTKEEMDKVAAKQLKLPAGAIESDYRFEYTSVDTATSGTKTTKMNVYEKLATGGEFMTTYDVQYNVSSVLTEKYVDDSGKELKIETQSLNSGQAYQPKPENYITIDGDTYIYQGWLTSTQTPGKDTPKEGNPPAVSNTTTYQYVYTKADNMINVTIPTEMVFGTYKSGSSTISSGKGVVKNNSKDVKTEVIMGELQKEKSSVTLLKPSDSSPVLLKEKKARLDLTADNNPVIKSLNESDKDKTIKELAPGEETTLGISGKYYGDLNKPQKVQYKMLLKFKVNP